MSSLFQNIAPTDLRDYAKTFGWHLIPEAVNDGLFVLMNPTYPHRQLVFPINSDVSDYAESIVSVVEKLSSFTGYSSQSIIASIGELKEDTIRFRVIDPRNNTDSLPLSYAISALNGAKELYLAAASTVLKPQVHHPRMSRTEAQELINKSEFKHTESGSFVLKVSSPVDALEIQGTLFDETIPFVRQSILAINDGLHRLVNAIQTDTLVQLVDELKTSETPEISSNLCKAITQFKEDRNAFDLYLNFTWAAKYPVTQQFVQNRVIKIQRDYFSRIDEVRRELRSTEQHRKEEIFMATVEHLAGEIDQEGRRAGEVILNLYEGDDEIIRARTILTAEQYLEADKAHMTPGSYIKIKGRLHPGNQPRSLTDVTFFELISP